MSTFDIIIQARMGSTRLPGKTLLPFGSSTVLEYLVDRARALGGARQVIVATTTHASDDAIERVCKKNGYAIFRGSAENVLDRYYQAAKKFDSNLIVRVTADNPFTDFSAVRALTQVLVNEHLDYVRNVASLPVGAGCEAFTFAALTRAIRAATHAYEKEHVTPYFYKTAPDLFKQRDVSAPATADSEHVRLTLDTPTDYERLIKIEKEFHGKALMVTTAELVDYVTNHPIIHHAS